MSEKSSSLVDVFQLLEELESALDVAQSDVLGYEASEHWPKTNEALAPARALANRLRKEEESR